MPAIEGLESRIQTLIKNAPSQAQLAQLSRVSEGSLINWKKGAGSRESELRKFAMNTGVSLAWLKEGRGDEEAEIDRMKRRFSESSPRQRLATAISRRGLTVPQLAKLIRYDSGVIEQVVKGTARASEKMIEAIVRELPELSKEELMDGSDMPVIVSETEATYGAKPRLTLPKGMKASYVPLLAYAQAGPWDAAHSDELYDHTCIIALNLDDRRAFALEVLGNSMEPVLQEGDMVICSPAKQPRNGEAAVIRTKSGQIYIKFWQKKSDRVVLESANEDYKPIEVPAFDVAGAWPIVQTVKKGAVVKQL